jgi:thiopeptide-type bacteriocin biosynthesis protein
VLLESVAPLTQELLNGGAADRWFFIRYGDPDRHLRIRFHGSPEIRPAVEAALSEQGWQLRMETYEREVERYGGAEGIEVAEEIFHADSDAVVELLSALEDQNHRWRMALLGMDSLLTDLRLELEAKERIARRLRDAFGKEHRIDTRFREKLGQRFRDEREGLERFFDATRPEALRRRAERLTPLADRLQALEQDGRLTESVETLAESFLHMHANRLLRSAHRRQELVLYDFLARLYRAQLARREA